ncbi:hypothetical protein OHB12_23715 [Nocardia sp. NBC_01730]|uniref:hypothetical protein n=1 Tax=Nocardia sp. NBC_01730 TaxID=2975998 RepID=UPI002E15C1EB|nr:hypothetical protein OHB12_23715 [Nocardia sp. NBC_01730]
MATPSLQPAETSHTVAACPDTPSPGLSDDVTAVDTADGFEVRHEEFDAYNGARFHIVSLSQGELRVRLELDADTGCWNTAVGPTSEARTMPAWLVSIGPSGSEYSAQLIVHAPRGRSSLR